MCSNSDIPREHAKPSEFEGAGSIPPEAPNYGGIARRVIVALGKTALYAVNALWAIPAVLLIRLVRPWVLVRVGPLRAERIGHFVLDAAIYIAERRSLRRSYRLIDLVWLTEAPANQQWARMVRRACVAGWWVRYLISFNHRMPGAATHEIMPKHGSRDVHGRLIDGSGRIEFTLDEDQRAKRWLHHRGWKDGAPFVCLLVRDAAYLNRHPLHSSRRWAYHDYRNSDIENFVPAIQALLDRGYWVFRMGQVMQKRVPINHCRLVDYPFIEEKDDLLDIWLSAHCALFISTGAGVDAVPVVYGRPVVFVNFLPLVNIYSYADNICVPKHLIWPDGTAATLRGHCEASFTQLDDYALAGIQIVDLTPDEITAAVLEGEARATGRWIETEEDKVQQRRFWEVLRQWPRFNEYHGFMHPRARVGRDWLRSAPRSFLD